MPPVAALSRAGVHRTQSSPLEIRHQPSASDLQDTLRMLTIAPDHDANYGK